MMLSQDYLRGQVHLQEKQAKTNGKKQWGARGITSLLFTFAFEVPVGESVKWNIVERSAMCLRWGRVIRRTYKRVGETTNEIFALLQRRDMWG